jgi:hypothetical protein
MTFFICRKVGSLKEACSAYTATVDQLKVSCVVAALADLSIVRKMALQTSETAALAKHVILIFIEC